MNKVLLTGRLTRDPEMRSLASGKNVTTFTVASNEYLSGGREKAEYSNVVTWDRLAEIAGTYLGKGQQVAIEGRLQTRSWDDKQTNQKKYMTEVVAGTMVLLGGRGEGGGGGAGPRDSANHFDQSAPEPEPAPAGSPITDEDIPF